MVLSRGRNSCSCYSMCMSLDRRVQILLDAERYAAVEQEANRTGCSVAALIRAAIDDRLSRRAVQRREAGRRLLASADPERTPGVDWAAEKAAIEGDLGRGLS